MDVRLEMTKLQERNKKVEKEKAWEISWLRRGCIFILTFLTAALVLKISGIEVDRHTFFVSAAIPSSAYFLSTLTLSAVRKLWEQWQ